MEKQDKIIGNFTVFETLTDCDVAVFVNADSEFLPQLKVNVVSSTHWCTFPIFCQTCILHLKLNPDNDLFAQEHVSTSLENIVWFFYVSKDLNHHELSRLGEGSSLDYAYIILIDWCHILELLFRQPVPWLTLLIHQIGFYFCLIRWSPYDGFDRLNPPNKLLHTHRWWLQKKNHQPRSTLWAWSEVRWFTYLHYL